MRDLMADLRAADPFRAGGGRPFRPADRARFNGRGSAALRAGAERQPAAREEGAVAGDREQRERGRDRHPDRAVAGFGGSRGEDRAREVDLADLVRPEPYSGM